MSGPFGSVGAGNFFGPSASPTFGGSATQNTSPPQGTAALFGSRPPPPSIQPSQDYGNPFNAHMYRQPSSQNPQTSRVTNGFCATYGVTNKTASTSFSPPPTKQTPSFFNTALQKENDILKKILKQGPYSDIKTGSYSDFKVKCFDKSFNLHRVMVCPRSPFFAAALRPGAFLESNTAEVTLPEDDPRIFTLFIQLLYLGQLDAEDSESMPNGALDYVKLYIMADKYGDPEVIELAFDLTLPKVSEVITKACSGKGNTPPVETENWNTFKTIIEHIVDELTSTDKLRHAVINEAAAAKGLLGGTKHDTLQFLRSVPEFAVEVLYKQNESKEEKKSGLQSVKSKKRVVFNLVMDDD